MGDGEMTSRVTASVRFGAPYNETFAESEGYTVTLRYQGRQMTVPFYMGPALCREPEAAEVLECLISDTMLGEQTFEDFCGDLGYDTDSRKAEASWAQCRSIAPRVRKLLGADFERIAY